MTAEADVAMIAPITPERSERPKAIVEKEETMKKLGNL